MSAPNDELPTMMGAEAGDEDAGSMRRRWKEQEEEIEDDHVKEMQQYFRTHYGDDDRTIFGLDGYKLFFFFYILVAGCVGLILFLALYIKQRESFSFFNNF